MLSIIDIIIDNKHKQYDLNVFRKDVVSFGRSSECDIQIPKNYVSRVHGCFYKENGEWFIKDMQSTNGIFYNANKIDALRLAVGPIRISKDMNSQDYITISLVGGGVGQQPAYTPQQPAFQQKAFTPEPSPQFMNQQNMPQNQGNPMAVNYMSSGHRVDAGMGLKIAMIIFAIVMVVACFLPYYGTGLGNSFGKWGDYADDLASSYIGNNLFSGDYAIVGVVVILNSVMLVVFSMLSHVYGLAITSVVISCFNPIWALMAWLSFKGRSIGFGKASIGFYMLLIASIGALVVAIMILTKVAKQRKANRYGYGM